MPDLRMRSLALFLLLLAASFAGCGQQSAALPPLTVYGHEEATYDVTNLPFPNNPQERVNISLDITESTIRLQIHVVEEIKAKEKEFFTVNVNRSTSRTDSIGGPRLLFQPWGANAVMPTPLFNYVAATFPANGDTTKPTALLYFSANLVGPQLGLRAALGEQYAWGEAKVTAARSDDGSFALRAEATCGTHCSLPGNWVAEMQLDAGLLPKEMRVGYSETNASFEKWQRTSHTFDHQIQDFSATPPRATVRDSTIAVGGTAPCGLVPCGDPPVTGLDYRAAVDYVEGTLQWSTWAQGKRPAMWTILAVGPPVPDYILQAPVGLHSRVAMMFSDLNGGVGHSFIVRYQAAQGTPRVPVLESDADVPSGNKAALLPSLLHTPAEVWPILQANLPSKAGDVLTFQINHIDRLQGPDTRMNLEYSLFAQRNSTSTGGPQFVGIAVVSGITGQLYYASQDERLANFL